MYCVIAAWNTRRGIRCSRLCIILVECGFVVSSLTLRYCCIGCNHVVTKVLEMNIGMIVSINPIYSPLGRWAPGRWAQRHMWLQARNAWAHWFQWVEPINQIKQLPIEWWEALLCLNDRVEKLFSSQQWFTKLFNRPMHSTGPSRGVSVCGWWPRVSWSVKCHARVRQRNNQKATYLDT